MNQSLSKSKLIEFGFYAGLALKGVNALGEIIGGVLMIVLNHDKLNRLIKFAVTPELKEDSNDFLMNYLMKAGENLSIGLQHSIAAYMLLHGTIKLAIIALLWKKKIWAYMPAILLFVLFILYEGHSYLQSHSIFMLLIIVIDAAIAVLIALEYRRLKRETKEKKI